MESLGGAGSGLLDRLAGLSAKWSVVTAIGTFMLYLAGYLALRFQLDMYGVVTNLDVFDGKYLFAGCAFFVYLVSKVPTVLLLVLILGVVFYLPYRLLPKSSRDVVERRLAAALRKPNVLPLIGVLFGLALIQFVLRNVFVYSNVLLQNQLPRQEWINSILLADGDVQALYFTGLVAGVLLTSGLLVAALRFTSAVTPLSRALLAVLVFLVAVEWLLLPVNYGMLINSQDLPRVAAVSESAKLSGGACAWLVWENRDVLTYFVREAADSRSLLTIPRKDNAVKIVAQDQIFQVLFGGTHEPDCRAR
jgi:hypothetical protein